MKRFLTGFVLLFIAATLQAQTPDDPTTLTANATSTTSISLSWTQITGSPAAEGYVLYALETGGTFPAATATPTDDSDLTDAAGVIKIIGNGTTTYSGFAGLSAATSYTFRIYTYRGTTLSNNYVEASEFTFSNEPGSHSTFAAVTNVGDGNRIDLAFAAASTLSDAQGYVIYRKQGSAPVIAGLVDGSAPPATLDGGNTVLVSTTNDTDAAYSDDGLTGGQTFHYVLVPFNWDGAASGTYNYLTAGAPAASATTGITITVVEIEGGGSNIEPSPLGSGSTTNAILGFSITVDGPTTLQSVTIPLTNDPTGSFNDIRLYQSSNTTYSTVGDTQIGSGTLGASGLDFATVNYALLTGTTHFFVVVDVDATVNAATPQQQASLSEANLTFSTGTASAFSFAGIDYSFEDTIDPDEVEPFSPADNATGVSVSLNQVIIAFTEEVVVIGTGADNANSIRIYNVTDNTTHETINPSTPGKVTLGGPGNTQATIALTTPFAASKSYAVLIGSSVFEDLAGNNYGGIASNFTWNFQTEAAPNVTGIENETGAGTLTSACINDVVTITGTNFGSLVKPGVQINGTFNVAAADILTFTNTEITFRLQNGAPNGTIRVTNNTNGLTSSASASSLTVLSAISTGLPYGLTPSAPAQGNDVQITLPTAQSGLDYDLFLDSFTDVNGVTDNTNSNKDTDDQTNGSVTLFTTALSVPGTYTYFVEASRNECVTRVAIPLISINISQLQAIAAASETTICAGETTTLQGSSQGGTGFNSYQWYDGATLIGTSTNLDVAPSATKTYTLRVTSTAPGPNNFEEDDITITVNSNPDATFLPGIKSKYNDQDFIYALSDSVEVSPPGGDLNISGAGVTKHANGKFYFDPKVVGVNPDHPIYLSYTLNNCAAYDTLHINVSATSAVIGLENYYCSNVVTSGTLQPNMDYLQDYVYEYWDGTGTARVEYEYTYKRLGFYACDVGTLEAPETDPLTEAGPNQYVLNIQEVVNRKLSNCFYIMIVADMKYTYTSGAGVVTTYDYVDQWAGYQYFQLTYIRPVPNITSLKEGQYICSDGSATLLETDALITYTSVGWHINDGPDNSISGNVFDPTEITFSAGATTPAPFTITYAYRDDNSLPAGGCPNQITRNILVVPKLSAPVANDEIYCQFYAERPVLKVNSYRSDLATSLAWYDAITTDKVGEGETLDTQVSTDVVGSKDFLLRQVHFGCESFPDDVRITIAPGPAQDITFDTQCEDREGTFSAAFAANTTWTWNMGDEASTVYNTNEVQHTYKNTGIYTIKLNIRTIENGKECSVDVVESVVVNQNPTPTFDYRYVCEGDYSEFTGGTKDFTIAQFQWDFGDGDIVTRHAAGANIVAPDDNAGRTNGTYRIPRHQFQSPGDYEVTMVGYTSQGCYDTLKRKVTVLEFLDPITSADPYLMANEEGGRGFWRVEALNDSSTWAFGPLNKSVIQTATPSWATGLTEPYKALDVSYLNSPCLDLENLEKPVLSLDYMINTPPNTDGAVLEYSVNNGKTWKSVGLPGEGSEWFNTSGFFLGNIGSSPVGWSGRELTNFVSGKHALDNLDSLSNPVHRRKVRFRIAFESDPSTQNDGFAFHNFNIVKRNRTLLVENFTNELDSEYDENNANFVLIPGLESTKIQYHVGYPDEDAHTGVNKTDPSARAAFYGVVLSDAVIPRVYVDGQSRGSLVPAGWAAQVRDERSLISSPFLINLDASGLVDGRLAINTTITTLENFSGRPMLHIAVVEKTAGVNEFVLRKMLPNAAGTEMPRIIAAGTELNFTQTYVPGSTAIDVTDLAVVVFVQDEVTHEIYQSEVALTTAEPSVVTGIEQPEFSDRVTVYPNPADDNFTLALPAKTIEELTISLIDSYGKVWSGGTITRGEQTKQVSTSHLSSGMYVLELKGTKGFVKKKVIVIHR